MFCIGIVRLAGLQTVPRLRTVTVTRYTVLYSTVERYNKCSVLVKAPTATPEHLNLPELPVLKHARLVKYAPRHHEDES